jgi:hypothetical protein
MPPITSTSRGFRCVALAVACLAGLAPLQAVQAQGTGTGPTAPPGSFIIVREVPTRPAYEPGVGDATWVETSPDQAFVDALDLGLSVIDDATAAAIATGPVLAQYPAGAPNFQSTDQAIGDTMISSGLAGLNQPGGGSVGSAIGAPLDAGLAAGSAGIDSAIGTVSGALSGLGGLGR